jgi:hypothetical protein
LRMAAMAWCARLTRLASSPKQTSRVMVHFNGPVAAQVRQQVTGAGLARGPMALL